MNDRQRRARSQPCRLALLDVEAVALACIVCFTIGLIIGILV